MRRLAAALALALGLLALSGCTARLTVDTEIDRAGVGSVELTLALDQEAQQALGFTDGTEAETARRLFPWLDDPGWTAPGGEGEGPVLVQRDDTGGLSLSTRHAVRSVGELRQLLLAPRTLAAIPLHDQVTDLAASVPLVNSIDLTIGTRTGDFPGFDLFARGGVGGLLQATCSGDRLLARGGVDARLRGGLDIAYRFTLPGGPGQTNADEVRGGRTAEWTPRFGDCPAMTASSGGGSSSTLINGVILGIASVLILFVLALRSLRGRRSRRDGS